MVLTGDADTDSVTAAKATTRVRVTADVLRRVDAAGTDETRVVEQTLA